MQEWCNSLCLCYVFVECVSFTSRWILKPRAIRPFPLRAFPLSSPGSARLLLRVDRFVPISIVQPHHFFLLIQGSSIGSFQTESLPISRRLRYEGGTCAFDDGPGKSSEEK